MPGTVNIFAVGATLINLPKPHCLFKKTAACPFWLQNLSTILPYLLQLSPAGKAIALFLPDW
jgi:hypothetical protein